MDRDIDSPRGERLLEFLDEESFAADFRERPARELVAAGANLDDLDLGSGNLRRQPPAHDRRLSQRKPARPRTNSNFELWLGRHQREGRGLERFCNEEISLFGLVSNAAARRCDESLNFFLGKAGQEPRFARNRYQAIVVLSDIFTRPPTAPIVQLGIQAILKRLRRG